MSRVSLVLVRAVCYDDVMERELDQRLSFQDWDKVSSKKDAEEFVRYIVEHP